MRVAIRRVNTVPVAAAEEEEEEEEERAPHSRRTEEARRWCGMSEPGA